MPIASPFLLFNGGMASARFPRFQLADETDARSAIVSFSRHIKVIFARPEHPLEALDGVHDRAGGRFDLVRQAVPDGNPEGV